MMRIASSIAASAMAISSGARKARTARRRPSLIAIEVVHRDLAAPVEGHAPVRPFGGEPRLAARDAHRDAFEIDTRVAQKMAQPEFVIAIAERRVLLDGGLEGARGDQIAVRPEPVRGRGYAAAKSTGGIPSVGCPTGRQSTAAEPGSRSRGGYDRAND